MACMLEFRIVLVALVLCFWGSCVAIDASGLLKAAQDIEGWIVGHRRELHKIPELQYDLPKTSTYLRGVLDELDISYKFPVAESGIIATIGSGKPIVALRADMDALPISEPKTLPYASKHDGHMHACGHDAHMAMLLGAAKLLKQREKTLKGTVRLIFQPAEEGLAGGKKMVEEGAVKDVSAIFGLHVWPVVDAGKIASRPGTLLAATNSFLVVVTGRGGHGAYPHMNIDPWPTVANLIMSYQTLVSRETDPLGSNVVSIGVVEGGNAFNVIPKSVQIKGTMRSITTDGIAKLERRMREMTKGISAAFNCEAEVTFDMHYPPTINDMGAYKFAMKTGERLLGEENVQETNPSMGGEDFAYYGQQVPAAFVLIGINNSTAGSTAPLHSPDFILDEAVLTRGAAYHVAMATSHLKGRTEDGAKEEL